MSLYKQIEVEPDSRLAWIRLLLVFVICAIGFIGMWSVVMIMPAVEQEFNTNRSSSTIPYILTMLGFGIGNIIIGKYTDKFGITKPVIFAFSCLIICYFFSVSSKNLTILSFFQFLLGFSSAAFFGPMMTDISNFFENKRGLAVSIVASAQHFAGAFWPFLLDFYLKDGDWRSSHILIGIICIIIIPPICYFVFKMRSKNSLKDEFKNYKNSKLTLSISSRHLQILLMFAGIGCCVGMSTPQVHIIPLCIEKGYGLSIGSNILSIMLFCAVISRVYFGYIADKIGPIQTLLLGSSLQAFTLFLFIPFSDLNSLYIVSILFGLSQGGIVPSYALIIRKFLPVNQAAERTGMVIFTTVIGMALGGWGSGKIFDLTNSYALGFLNSVLWNLTNIAIILFIFVLYKKNKNKLLSR
ncbi:MAG: MFS transporter [SAR116 cluster bacterium]|nr:MFS transporter [SAR116 cluster bacterium]|tara:strand:- start:3112 stop:4344 length:1233 start_codon:yes stop_codon:yes gene_type:complete